MTGLNKTQLRALIVHLNETDRNACLHQLTYYAWPDVLGEKPDDFDLDRWAYYNCVRRIIEENRTMIVYKFNDDSPAPIPVEVESLKIYSTDADADGETIYSGTHYESISDCWEQLNKERTAWVSMSARNVRDAKEKLALAEQDASRAAEAFAATAAAYSAWNAQ